MTPQPSDQQAAVPSLGIGIGAVGHGGRPSPTRTRPDLCGAYGHPPCTYNSWSNKTWCLCGRTIADGDRVTVPHVACCDGVLIERVGGAA